jgi:hypothetical protein
MKADLKNCTMRPVNCLDGCDTPPKFPTMNPKHNHFCFPLSAFRFSL